MGGAIIRVGALNRDYTVYTVGFEQKVKINKDYNLVYIVYIV